MHRYTLIALLSTAALATTACVSYPDDPQGTGCTAHLDPGEPDWQAQLDTWETQLAGLQQPDPSIPAEGLAATIQAIESIGQEAQVAAAGRNNAFLCLKDDGSTNEALNTSEGARRRNLASQISARAQALPDAHIAAWISARATESNDAGLVAANIIVPTFSEYVGPATEGVLQTIDTQRQAELEARAESGEHRVCADGLCNCIFTAADFSEEPYDIFFEVPSDAERITMRCFFDQPLKEYAYKGGIRLELRSHDSRSVGLYIEGPEPVVELMDSSGIVKYLKSIRSQDYVDVPLDPAGEAFGTLRAQMEDRGDPRRVAEITFYVLSDDDEPMITPLATGHIQVP